MKLDAIKEQLVLHRALLLMNFAALLSITSWLFASLETDAYIRLLLAIVSVLGLSIFFIKQIE